MMEYRISDKLNSILTLSKEEAERLTHSEVTAEHLLLGMIRDGHNNAVELLVKMGVNLTELRMRLESENQVPDANADKVPIEKIALSVAVTRLLKISMLEARLQKKEEADAEHLLLAMVRDRASSTARILSEYEIDYRHLLDCINNTSMEPQMGMGLTDDDDEEEDDDMMSSRKDASQSKTTATTSKSGSKTPVLDTFSTDTVFTYTFATPRTTKQPKRGIYPNIYNIVGKMDPVPSVPFADWGYERYGTTLMLPAQETDSDYALKFERAYQVYYKLVGIAFWNNVEINTKLRVILNYLLKLLPTSQTYEKHMQSHMLSIWEDRRVTNVMDELMEIAGNKELINDNNQKEANSLLTYVAYSAYNYATNRSIETKYASYESTLTGNLAHEHTPEVYLAWLFSQPDGDNLYSVADVTALVALILNH